MSSKSKTLLKQSKAKRKKEQSLDTADDYQAAGVDFEDAAGKWRAGDPVKSMRFFVRALEVYDQGLHRFPQSFDLAYNKARVQLEVATHPVLIKQLEQPVLAVLQAALESHRYALDLDQENTDTLFNTAQVLTSIAEELSKVDTNDDVGIISYLEEALQLQDRCLSLQELKYEENQEHDETTRHPDASTGDIGDEEEDVDGGAPLEPAKEQEEQWFSIIEPVTKDTLVDTALAQLGTLTTLCGILSISPQAAPPAMLAWIEEYSSRILNKKLPLYIDDQNQRLSEIAIAKGNFISALLEAGFRAHKLDATTYKRERDVAFTAPELDLERSAEALLANARSLMSFSSALGDTPLENIVDLNVTRWNALSAAIANLVTASKVAGVSSSEVATTQLLRGDCSMLQRHLGLAPSLYQAAISNGPQLLKNAEVFYRNASKLSPDAGDKSMAALRSAVAQYLQSGDSSMLITASKERQKSWVTSQVDDMVDEGILPAGFNIS